MTPYTFRTQTSKFFPEKATLKKILFPQKCSGNGIFSYFGKDILRTLSNKKLILNQERSYSLELITY